MKFSDKVFYLRQKNKLTQVELAEKAHVKQSTIQAYESGRAKPFYGTAVQLANALGVDIDDLLNDGRSVDTEDKADVVIHDGSQKMEE